MARKTKASRSKTSKSQKTTKVAQPAPVEETQVAAPVAEVQAEVQAAAPAQTGGAKRQRKTKVVKKTLTTDTENITEAETPTETVTATETEGGRKVRSFKAMLPNSETYEGRFTGISPYQAACKALSKYYRDTKKPKKEITFQIRESTRGSRRSEHTYRGGRVKLDTPIEYTIKSSDGEERVITKCYKNRLTKVKKAELAAQQSS